MTPREKSENIELSVKHVASRMKVNNRTKHVKMEYSRDTKGKIFNAALREAEKMYGINRYTICAVMQINKNYIEE